MNYYPFYTAYTQARELYGLELKPDEFETLGLIAWGKIGNNRYKLYKYTQKPDKSINGEYYLDLPCNVDIIEAVTANYEDSQITSSIKNTSDNLNRHTEEYIESFKQNTNSLYIPGKYIKYRLENNRLFLSDFFNEVNVLYKGFIVDETGLPLLNASEIDAIAGFCIFADTRKKAIMTRDSNLMQLAMNLEVNWKHLCTQSRSPEYINQNEMDEILNVSTSWDRKRFGKSFKPLR